MAYAVEGWWLDSLLKAGKLSRETYLALAAKVTVGFQKRLADVRAAERYEKDCALDLAIKQDAVALQSRKLPMRVFPEVEALSLVTRGFQPSGDPFWRSKVVLGWGNLCWPATCYSALLTSWACQGTLR